MRITARPLNYQALALEEAEGKIRVAVKDALFRSTPRDRLNKTVRKIIEEALSDVKIEALKAAAYRSLGEFYARLLRVTARIPKRTIETFLALNVLTEGGSSPELAKLSVTKAEGIVRRELTALPSKLASNYATEIGRYHKEYVDEFIRPTMDRLAKEEALDPDSKEYLGERQSLRARAEREVRFNNHQSRREDFLMKGVKLVIIPPHANCSERCRPFQGRVFSLDGTSGTAPDGRKYEPIEKATEIFVKTKKGTVWKNGLFGFNCRHTMVEYKPGLSFPQPSPDAEAKEYKIDVRQRELERRIIKYKVRAEMYRGSDKKAYQKARKKARYWESYYQEYSRRNDRAYYPSRTKTL